MTKFDIDHAVTGFVETAKGAVEAGFDQIYDRTSAEDALVDADIVLSAKSILLNPNWVEDVRSGKDLPLYKSEEANVVYNDKPLP